MGQTQSLSTEIEIKAPPATVRSVVRATAKRPAIDVANHLQFMNFPRYNEWCSWTIEPVDSSKDSSKLKIEDRLKVDMKGTAFRPLVKVSLGLVSRSKLSWVGNLHRPLRMGGIVVRASSREALLLLHSQPEDSGRYHYGPDGGLSRSASVHVC